MEAFTTRGLPARRKIAYWNAINSESFAAMEIAPRNPSSFDGELRRERIGSLTLLDVHSTAVHIRHNQFHVARTREPSYLVLTPLRGHLELRGSGNSHLRIAKQEYCLLDHAEPYELAHGDDVRALCLDIPRGVLHSMLAHPEDAVGRVMRRQEGPSRFLLVLLNEIGMSIHPAAHTSQGRSIAQGLLGLLVAAYSDEIDTSRPTGVRRHALLDCIEARLHEHGLTPADVASDVGLSPRRTRAVLAAGGLSFSSYVLRRRLERCAALLDDPSWQDRSITEIAFRNGFNNVTHFGYTFKKRFGLTPSQYRARIT